ncbi:MAG: hypothetical protein Q9187_005651 [Circinaria calcarea]
MLGRELSSQRHKHVPSPVSSRPPNPSKRVSKDHLDDLKSALMHDHSDTLTSNNSACVRSVEPSRYTYDHSNIRNSEIEDCDFEQLVQDSWSAPVEQNPSFRPPYRLNKSQAASIPDHSDQGAECESVICTDQTLGFLEPTPPPENVELPTNWPYRDTEPEFCVDPNLADLEPQVTSPKNKCIGLAATNNLGQTALHVAAEKGDLSIVRLLLESSDIPVNARDAQGSTALHLAAAGGYCDVVRLLLEANEASARLE